MAHNRLTRKRFATLLLACMMLLSFCAFVFAACATTETGEDDSSSSETRTDTQTFANANFEYFDDSDGSYLIGSADSWTRSAGSNSSGTSASSSLPKSGIVDTSFNWGDAEKGFYQAYADYLYYDELEDEDPDSAELKDAKYYKDIDNYYDIPGWDVVKTTLENDVENSDETAPDLTKKETIEAHAEEIAAAAKALNPGTHWTAAETADEENGTHVLMLHNYRTDGNGTAQKYTSSAITLAAGTVAKFSVWVNTKELTFNGGESFTGNRGAYIAVSNTVGGTSQDSLVVRNIITGGEWQQFTFYVQASDYATTTFSVELGLGNQDQASSSNSYVQGYAFFDDLHYEVKMAASFASEIEAVPAAQKYTLDLSFGSSFNAFDATTIGDAASRSFVLDLNDITPADLALTLDTANADGVNIGDYASNVNGVRPTTDDKDNTIETALSALLKETELQRLINSKATDQNYSGWKSLAELTASSVPAALSDAFKNYSKLPFATDNDILVLYSSEGAPYTATATNNSLFTLGEDEYLLISFWVKTSDVRGGTGATVSVVETDTDAKTSIGALDTTTLTPVGLSDDYNGKKGCYEDGATEIREDIFDGWQKCFFFVANTTDKEVSFALQFHYGITGDFSSTTSASYIPGFAAFAGFEYTAMTEAQFNTKTTGTYAVAATLNGSDTSAVSDFDDVAGIDSEAIKTGFGTPSNYKGVYGNSHYVGGSIVSGDQSKPNANATAGLLSADYAADYFNNSENSAWMDILTTANWYTQALNADNWWNELFGEDSTQPLLIVNTVAQSYGYIANSASSISTSSYTAVTVRVKLSPGATANIYLIDTTAPEIDDDALAGVDEGKDLPKRYTDTLGYSTGISYRYDNEGNVVNLDPSDKNFSAMNNTVFTMQDNGLWLPYGSSDTSVYYANLANYEKDKDGNLVDSKDSIIYYASETDGEYYRYYDKDRDRYSVRVRDFSAAEGVDLTGAILQDLRDESFGKSLMQTVSYPSTETTVSDWIYVRFFIATGDVSKNYRLEVWSGDRTGETTNPANSFVAFEMVNYGSIDADVFNNLVSLRVDELIEAYNAKLTNSEDRIRNQEELVKAYRENPAQFANGYSEYGTDLIYFLYSLYDDTDYASYDENYSESTNNPYTDYDATSYTDTVSYLRTNYVSTNGRTYYDTYVNYGASDITIAASSDSDEDTTEDTTDTTPGYNVWLLIISIVLAVVLIFTLVVLLIRKLLSNMKKRPAKATQSYDNKRKRYIRKLKLEEAEKDDSAEDVLPEDDEISEEDIYKVETDEEKAETSSEEASEGSESASETPSSEEEKKDE